MTTEDVPPEGDGPQDEVGVHFVSPLTVRQITGSHKWFGISFAALALGLVLAIVFMGGVVIERADRLRTQDRRIDQLSADSACRAQLSADVDVVFVDAFLFVLNRPADPAAQAEALAKLLGEVNAARERRARTDELCHAADPAP